MAKNMVVTYLHFGILGHSESFPLISSLGTSSSSPLLLSSLGRVHVSHMSGVYEEILSLLDDFPRKDPENRMCWAQQSNPHFSRSGCCVPAPIVGGIGLLWITQHQASSSSCSSLSNFPSQSCRGLLSHDRPSTTFGNHGCPCCFCGTLSTSIW